MLTASCSRQRLTPRTGRNAKATSFAATFALGEIARKWFDGNMETDVEQLKKAYEAAKKKAHAEYNRQKTEIEAQQKAQKMKLKTLAEELRVGELTQEQYQQKVADLR